MPNSMFSNNYKSKNIYDLNKEFFDFIHLLNTYKKYVKPWHLVVEIGASNKSRTFFISKYCKKLVGVEYFSERLPQNFSNVRYINGDWQELSKYFKKNSVDILVSSQCLEHVKNDLSAINEAYKILKKGGVVILNTPNRRRLVRAIIEMFTGPRKFPYWEHFREYTKNDLLDLINKSKFKKYKIEPVCFGIKPKRNFCLKKCPKIFERICIHWELLLFK